MSDNEVKRLELAPSVHGVINSLTADLPQIEEIYVIVKRRDGGWYDSISGDTAGIAFAILLLQHVAAGSLNG